MQFAQHIQKIERMIGRKVEHAGHGYNVALCSLIRIRMAERHGSRLTRMQPKELAEWIAFEIERWEEDQKLIEQADLDDEETVLLGTVDDGEYDVDEFAYRYPEGGWPEFGWHGTVG